VRFFIQLPSGELADRAANVLRTSLEVEIIEGPQPPTKTYERCVEFDLKNHYALPMCKLSEKPLVNPIDEVAGALSGGDAALEVVVVGAPKARRGILSYIDSKTKPSASFAGALLDAFQGILGGFFGGSPPRKGREKVDLNAVTKAKVEAAGEKANENLFLCEARAYGDRKAVEALEGALPFSPMNKLKAWKAVRAVEAPPQELRKPKNYMRENALSKLWAAPLILIPAVTWLLGAFDPFRLANVDLFIIALTAGATVPLALKFPKRNPLVLCTDELSLIVARALASTQMLQTSRDASASRSALKALEPSHLRLSRKATLLQFRLWRFQLSLSSRGNDRCRS
jgi:hypothetical protein